MAGKQQFALRGTKVNGDSSDRVLVFVDEYMILSCIREFTPKQIMEAVSQWLNCHSYPVMSTEAAEYLEDEHRQLQTYFFYFAMAIIYKLAWHHTKSFTDERNKRTSSFANQLWRYYLKLLDNE